MDKREQKKVNRLSNRKKKSINKNKKKDTYLMTKFDGPMLDINTIGHFANILTRKLLSMIALDSFQIGPTSSSTKFIKLIMPISPSQPLSISMD